MQAGGRVTTCPACARRWMRWRATPDDPAARRYSADRGAGGLGAGVVLGGAGIAWLCTRRRDPPGRLARGCRRRGRAALAGFTVAGAVVGADGQGALAVATDGRVAAIKLQAAGSRCAKSPGRGYARPPRESSRRSRGASTGIAGRGGCARHPAAGATLTGEGPSTILRMVPLPIGDGEDGNQNPPHLALGGGPPAQPGGGGARPPMIDWTFLALAAAGALSGAR